MQRSKLLTELRESWERWKNTEVNIRVPVEDGWKTDGIFPMRVWMSNNKYEPIVMINGQGFRYLRRKHAHEVAEYKPGLIPLTQDDHGKYIEPYHDRLKNKARGFADVGYVYSTKDVPALWAFFKAVEEVNTRYAGQAYQSSPPNKKKDTTTGIIGYDFPYEEPSWLKRYTKGNKKYNPYITSSGVYFFGAASIENTKVRKAVKRLQSIDPDIWKHLMVPLNMRNRSHMKKMEEGIQQHGFVVFQSAWDEHARTLMSDPNNPSHIWVIDPWMPSAEVNKSQEFQALTKNKTYRFIPQDKNPDQAYEGSCVIASFARCLWIAKEGPDVALQHPIPYEYAILSIRLLRPRNKVILRIQRPNQSSEGSPTHKTRKLSEQDIARVNDENEDALIDPDDMKVKLKVHKKKAKVKRQSIPSDGPFVQRKVAEVKSDAPSNKRDISNLPLCMQYDHTKLLRHQKKIVTFMKDKRQRGILLFHSLGSGKTITAIAIARCLAEHPTARVVIATPSSVSKQFEAEVSKLIPTIEAPKYQVVTHNRLAKHSEMVDNNTVLVVDEAHNFRNADSKLTQGMLQAAANAYKVVLASATPVVNDVTDFAVPLAMIHGQTSTSKFEEHLAQYHKHLRMLRCIVSYYQTPMDVRNFPRVKEQYKTFRMDPVYYDAYMEIQRKEFPPTKELKLAGLEEDQKSAFYTRLRRAANAIADMPNAKLEWTLQRIQTDVNHGRKVAIFSSFLSNGIDLLTARLDEMAIPYTKLSGDMTPTKRLAAVKAYNDGAVKVFIFTMAGAEGVDLKGTRTMIVLDPWWNSGKMNQIIGRVARYQSHIKLPKEDRTVDILYMVMKKPKKLAQDDQIPLSVDEIMYRMAESKHKSAVKFYDILKARSAEVCKMKSHGRKSA